MLAAVAVAQLDPQEQVLPARLPRAVQELLAAQEITVLEAPEEQETAAAGQLVVSGMELPVPVQVSHIVVPAEEVAEVLKPDQVLPEETTALVAVAWGKTAVRLEPARQE